MTNFEFIEINDAAAVPRKVAGDFETQGPDSIFHQTARNLNTRLEAATGVTLSSATPTDIALNGMESHVLLDIGSRIENDIKISLQYFPGGPFYASDWTKLQPLAFVPGQFDQASWYPIDAEGWKTTGQEASNVFGGTHVFAIPTNGAVTCRLQLYGSSVTKTGVAWARIVLNSPPVVQAIVKPQRMFNRPGNGINAPTGEASYTNGDWVGGTTALLTGIGTPGSPHDALVALKSLSIGPRSFGSPTMIGDCDVILTTQSINVVDGTLADSNDVYVPYVVGILEFRSIPGQGQYKLTDIGGQKIGFANDLDFITPSKPNPTSQAFMYASVITREEILVADVGANGYDFGYLIDWG